MHNKFSSQKGVALLMSLGLLALLSILGIAFATNMRLLERTTRDFIYEVQARYLAEGGIEYAIAQLKQDARNNFIFNNNVVVADQTGLIDGSGSIRNITIIDTARQVNLNNANIDLLDCLPGIGKGGGSKGQAIINARNKAPFITKKSVCLASGIGSGTYENIKDLISTYTYIDENVQDDVGESQKRSAININTVDKGLLENIIAKVDSNNAATIANNIKSARPINSWEQFNKIAGMTDKVKEAFNPNRRKSSGYYGTFPTEFCFHSGGIYELTVNGTISKAGQIVANKTITTIAQIFDLNNFTKKTDFSGNAANIPEYARVTWLDSCPTTVDLCYTGAYDTDPIKTNLINDSLKLGYWDDFSEDTTYSNSQWTPNSWKFSSGESYTDGFTIDDGELKTWSDPGKPPSYGGKDPDRKPLRIDSYPKIDLGSITVPILNTRWRWFSFSLRCRIIDEQARKDKPPNRDDIPWHSIPKHWEDVYKEKCLQKWQNVGQILFLRTDIYKNSVFITYPDNPRPPYTPILVDTEDANGDEKVDAADRYYKYSIAGISDCKIWAVDYEPANPLFHDGDTGGTPPKQNPLHKCSGHNSPNRVYLILSMDNYWPNSDGSRNDLPPNDKVRATYESTKDIHLTVRTASRVGVGDSQVKAKISNFEVDSNYANPFNASGPGLIALYGNGNLPCLDNIRIISQDGYYISPSIDFGAQPFEWGTIFWTMTTPSTVYQGSNPRLKEEVHITFEVASGNSNNFTASWISNEEDPYNRTTHGNLGWDRGNYPGAGNGYPMGLATGNRYLRFKALLENKEPEEWGRAEDFLDDFSETPVLEDVWFTYLPKTRILYWREN